MLKKMKKILENKYFKTSSIYLCLLLVGFGVGIGVNFRDPYPDEDLYGTIDKYYAEIDSILFSDFESGEDFRAKIALSAMKLYPKTNIIPSILVSQAILESGHGKYIKGNNVFGIKAGKNWYGETISFPTREQLPLSYKSVKGYKFIRSLGKGLGEFECVQKFRKYDNIHESIRYYFNFLKTGYSKIVGVKTHKEAVNILVKGGYATDRKYAQKLNAINTRYNGDLLNGMAFILNEIPNKSLLTTTVSYNK
jgi:hypothetical protein